MAATDVNPLEAPLDTLNPSKTPNATIGEKTIAIQTIRKALSVTQNVESVIDGFFLLNPMPVLLPYLNDPNDSFVFETAWIMTNIASSTSAHCQVLIDNRVHEEFTRLLSHTSLDVVEQSIWALGNIAGDCIENRDMLLKSGIAETLCCAFLRPDAGKSFRTNLAWALSNLCRAKPRPSDEHLTPIYELFSAILKSENVNVLLNPQENEWLTDVLWAISYLSDGSNSNIQKCLDYGLLQHVLKLYRSEVDAPGIADTDVAERKVACEHLGEVLSFLPQNDLFRLCALNKDVFLTSVCDHKEVYNRLRETFVVSTRAMRVPTLRIVGNVVTGDDIQTTVALNSGAVGLLEALLKLPQLPESELREVLWTLSNIAAGPPQHCNVVTTNKIFLETVHLGLLSQKMILIREAAWVVCNVNSCLSNFLASDPLAVDKLLVPCIALRIALSDSSPEDRARNKLAMLEEMLPDDETPREPSTQSDTSKKLFEKLVSEIHDGFNSGKSRLSLVPNIAAALTEYRHSLEHDVYQASVLNLGEDKNPKDESHIQHPRIPFHTLVGYLFNQTVAAIAELPPANSEGLRQTTAEKGTAEEEEEEVEEFETEEKSEEDEEYEEESDVNAD